MPAKKRQQALSLPTTLNTHSHATEAYLERDYPDCKLYGRASAWGITVGGELGAFQLLQACKGTGIRKKIWFHVLLQLYKIICAWSTNNSGSSTLKSQNQLNTCAPDMHRYKCTAPKLFVEQMASKMKWVIWKMISTLDTLWARKPTTLPQFPFFAFIAAASSLFYHTNVCFNELAQQSSGLSAAMCWKGLSGTPRSYLLKFCHQKKGNCRFVNCYRQSPDEVLGMFSLLLMQLRHLLDSAKKHPCWRSLTSEAYKIISKK